MMCGNVLTKLYLKNTMQLNGYFSKMISQNVYAT